ncbi:hypothetical protein ACIRD2_05590 [Streptomyces sp. NPDC093595]
MTRAFRFGVNLVAPAAGGDEWEGKFRRAEESARSFRWFRT